MGVRLQTHEYFHVIILLLSATSSFQLLDKEYLEKEGVLIVPVGQETMAVVLEGRIGF
jgi:hypothetical protein